MKMSLIKQSNNIVTQQLVRCLSTTTGNNVNTYFYNRNPRNLEKLRIARKPIGYALDKPGRSFWHKLELTESSRRVTAKVVHHLNGPVLQVSTSEWALRKQLYSTKDTPAYINLGKMFSQLCLEAGLTEMQCDIVPNKGGKIEKFIEEVQKGGVVLKEADRYKVSRPWDMHRPEKPWEVLD